MRNSLPILLLTTATALGGCELLVRFDPDRLDGGRDVQDVNRPDIQPVDVVDVPQPVDAVDVPGDSADVTVDTEVDVVDAGVDAAPETGTDAAPDAEVDATTDTGTDATTDAGTDAPADAGPFLPLNGCTLATATDLTATSATRTITFPGSGGSPVYTPSCIIVSAGQTVTFTADTGTDFAAHPLVGGDASTRTPQTGNPIGTTNFGSTVSYTFSTVGSWGFYCQIHFTTMQGTVYVQP